MRGKLREHGRLRAALAGLAVAGALSGCGVSQELYDRQTTELDRCKQEQTRNNADLERARAEVEQIQGVREHASSVEADYFKLKQDLRATQQQLDQLHRARQRAELQAEVLRSLRDRLQPALDGKTVAVEVRKGRMVVRLAEELLFEPGKAEVKPTGAAALRQVAGALQEIPDRDFLVAGHSDNVPVKGSPFRSNWELTTARAVAVVRLLQAEGVNPSHLAAAGYSEFDAVSDNDSAEGRARNRRLEVVVMPTLDELPTVTLPPTTRQAAPPAGADEPTAGGGPARAPSSPAAPSRPAPAPPPR